MPASFRSLRTSGWRRPRATWTSCAASFRESLPRGSSAEPARRNSGPAILAAALRFAADGDPVVAVVPSDQTVSDAEALRRALTEAAALADRANVVVLAVPPSRPETDFGYLEVRGRRRRALLRKAGRGRRAGVRGFRPALLERRHVRFPAVAVPRGGPRRSASLVEGVERYARTGAAGDYEALPDISIDFAVMEKIPDARAVPLDAGWSDVGTWRSVRELRGRPRSRTPHPATS